VILKWKRIGKHTFQLPTKSHADDAGFDLRVIVEPALKSPCVSYDVGQRGAQVIVYPGALVNFRVGWAVQIPTGWSGHVKVRSSTGKARWILASSGLIDAGYIGELCAPLLYLGADPYTVTHGERMIQMVIVPVPEVECVEAEELADTARGAGGFGSTGKQ
jgi:dUTP pyrophosphatase